LKWLHPDFHSESWESLLAQRVNSAWHRIKNSPNHSNTGTPASNRSPAAVDRRESPLVSNSLPWIPLDQEHRAEKKWGGRIALGTLAVAAIGLAVYVVRADLPRSCRAFGWACATGAAMNASETVSPNRVAAE
jgi:hypothetical protein